MSRAAEHRTPGADDRRRDVDPTAPAPRVFPSEHTLALMLAAQARDLRRIDEVTDDLVALGKCRPRTDASMFGVSNRFHQHEGQQ